MSQTINIYKFMSYIVKKSLRKPRDLREFAQRVASASQHGFKHFQLKRTLIRLSFLNLLKSTFEKYFFSICSDKISISKAKLQNWDLLKMEGNRESWCAREIFLVPTSQYKPDLLPLPPNFIPECAPAWAKYFHLVWVNEKERKREKKRKKDWIRCIYYS